MATIRKFLVALAGAVGIAIDALSDSDLSTAEIKAISIALLAAFGVYGVTNKAS